MEEYSSLGHMKQIEFSENDSNVYYLPHHCVERPDAKTTKLRVVFNASFQTTSGVSLNDILMVGPVVQDDLVSIILRFRMHQFVFSVDCKKMYRQIQVHPSDRDLQRIIWRNSPDEAIQVFQLTTVTYGTSPASYIATKCLNVLASEEAQNFPLASAAICDFYMDDCMTGGNDLPTVRAKQTQLIEMCAKGGFELHKWVSNHSDLLTDVNPQSNHIQIDGDESVKALGLFWNPHNDTFYYRINAIVDTKATKRSILSEIARLFDPIGILSPVILLAKVIMRSLWQAKIDWDDSPTPEIQEQWSIYQKELLYLNDLQIDRWVYFQPKFQTQIHGFCDASEVAFGACIYLLCRDESENIRVNLICAKSKIAPLKTQTIPRLELCGALLLSQLMNKITKSLKLENQISRCWSDSSIALTWLHSDPSRLLPFVRNRAMQIQELNQNQRWSFVSGKQNPADIVSRGMFATQLIENPLWWQGPEWLSAFKETDHLIPEDKTPECLIEFAKDSNVNVNVIHGFELFNKISSARKIIRIMAYCHRFINACRRKVRETKQLTPEECVESLQSCIKISQQECYAEEIKCLLLKKSVDKSSHLYNLRPFLSNGLIRVGGRLKNANIAFDQQCPIVMPQNHIFTKLYATMIHKDNLHCGPQQLLSTIRQRFWPPRGNRLVANIVKKCVTCFHAKPTMHHQFMGDLPADRVQQNRCFLNVGVDYAGPIGIKSSNLRNAKILKSYIAVYVCFATKAIHLELVSDLTTAAFMASLKRFISRRGLCANIYSDNGSNFVGADNELKHLYEWLAIEANQNQLNDALLPKQIRWHFSPPYAPHRGGLFEAGVKSVKHHLRRTLGNASLTFEQLYTLLTEIEAILNSRPLTPLTANPDDFRALTPAHFLISEEMNQIPERNLQNTPDNRLSKWEHLKKLKQLFWSRWSQEYLPLLQQRSKWNEKGSLIAVGDMVLIQQDDCPPLKWPLGRIVALHNGDDKLPRSADVRMQNGIKRRVMQKLCPLPKE